MVRVHNELLDTKLTKIVSVLSFESYQQQKNVRSEEHGSYVLLRSEQTVLLCPTLKHITYHTPCHSATPASETNCGKHIVTFIFRNAFRYDLFLYIVNEEYEEENQHIRHWAGDTINVHVRSLKNTTYTVYASQVSEIGQDVVATTACMRFIFIQK